MSAVLRMIRWVLRRWRPEGSRVGSIIERVRLMRRRMARQQLSRIGARMAGTPGVRWLLRFQPKVRGVTTARPADPAKDLGLVVPYQEGGAALGIQGFVLGLDGVDHASERGLLEPILETVRSADPHQHGLEAIRELMAIRLRKGRPIELTGIFEQAARDWSEHLVGLPRDARVMDAGRAVMSRTLFNAEFTKTFDPQRASRDVEIVGRFRGRIERLAPEAGTLYGALADRPNVEPQPAVRDVIGMIGGATELIVETCVSIMDWALTDPSRWTRAHEAADEAADPGAFRDAVASMVAAAPPQYFLVRGEQNAPAKHTLVSLWESAEWAPPDPLHPTWGIAPHRCLGRDLALDALAEILHPVFSFAMASYVPMPFGKSRPSEPPINRPIHVVLGTPSR